MTDAGLTSRRPLAIFGLGFLLASLVLLRRSAGALLAVAAIAAACWLAVFLAGRLARRAKPGVWASALRSGVPALVLAAVLLAALLGFGFQRFRVQPAQALAGQEDVVAARVLQVEPGYGNETVHITVQVLESEAGRQTPRRLYLRGVEKAEAGQLVRLPVRYSAFSTQSAGSYYYSKGVYVQASVKGPLEVLGVSHTPLTLMRSWQYAAGDAIRSHTPTRLSSVAAAMAVGDRRYLPQDAVEAYRAAGISHILVVSGLHLSLLCGPMDRLFRRLFKSGRAAAVGSLAFVLCFMLFTGLTVSVVRSGLAWVMMYLARLFYRKADVFTSMGLAALVLVAQNPHASADVGLLLSFAATLGALGGGEVEKKLRRHWAARDAERARPGSGAARRGVGLLRRLARSAVMPVVVTLLTLPVLVYAGMGISLFTIPMNMLAVPFVKYIVACGLLMALPQGVPVLGWIGGTAGFINMLLLRFLEWLTGLCAGVDAAWLPVGGLYGFLVVAVLYLLAVWAWKKRRPLAGALALCMLAPLAVFLHMALNSGTVRVVVAGSGSTSSVVVAAGGQAVVLYRGSQSLNAAANAMKENNVRHCALLVDLRRTAQGTGYEGRLAPEEAVMTQEDVAYRAVYTPLPNIQLYLLRQADGLLACVEVDGYRVGVVSGSVDLAGYPPLDALVPGGGTVKNASYTALLAGEALPEESLPSNVQLLDAGVMIWIRPGKSVVYRSFEAEAWLS